MLLYRGFFTNPLSEVELLPPPPVPESVNSDTGGPHNYSPLKNSQNDCITAKKEKIFPVNCYTIALKNIKFK